MDMTINRAKRRAYMRTDHVVKQPPTPDSSGQRRKRDILFLQEVQHGTYMENVARLDRHGHHCCQVFEFARKCFFRRDKERERGVSRGTQLQSLHTFKQALQVSSRLACDLLTSKLTSTCAPVAF